MAQEETDIPAALQAEGEWIRHLHIADQDHGLPSTDTPNFAAAAAALQAMGYSGWAALTGTGDAASYAERLPASIAYLRELGMR